MKFQRVDSLDGIDVSALTFADIAYGVGSGVSLCRGQGRYKSYSYRRGVITDLGDVEESLWRKLAEQVIEAHGEGWLLKALETWYKEHNYARYSASDLHMQALNSHSTRLFDREEWVDYLSFNQRYRPHLLAGRVFPRIRVQCCNNAEGRVTEVWLHRDTAPCPACGAFCRFEVVNENE